MKRLSLFVLIVAMLVAGCDMLGLGDDADGTEALYYVNPQGGASEVAIAYDEDGQTRRDTLRGNLWSYQLEDPSGTLRLSVENLSAIPPAEQQPIADTIDGLTGYVRPVIFIDDEIVAADSTLKDTTITINESGASQDTTITIGTPRVTVEHEL